MEAPSKRRFALLVGVGFILALCEPIILLLMGNDLGGAFWPMAKRSLELTYFLREFRALTLAFFIIAIPFSYQKSKHVSNLERNLLVTLVGMILGLLFIYLLLNLAYFRGAFLLLPTTLGFLLLCVALMIGGLPKNPFKGGYDRIKRISHLFAVTFSIWLILPGLISMAGLSPYPPKLDMKSGSYSVSVESHEYPMPDEVSSIQGDYEEDVVFSVYIALPEAELEGMPLAILLHGFANPFFESYRDWVVELASRGVAVAYIQYPSDVMPPGHDTFELHEEAGMSNHPYHEPRSVAIESALEFMITLLPDNVEKDFLLVGGHSLGAGYAFLALDWALGYGWGSQALFVSMEAPYARPVQEHLQFNTSRIPSNFISHVAVSEDDMSVNECLGVHHQSVLGNGSLFIEVPSDRHGFPRLVATHYLQATETHDDLADWAFYRRVANQANWLTSSLIGDTPSELHYRNQLTNTQDLKYMGEWSDGKPVKKLRVWDDAINSEEFRHCQTWTGP